MVNVNAATVKIFLKMKQFSDSPKTLGDQVSSIFNPYAVGRDS